MVACRACIYRGRERRKRKEVKMRIEPKIRGNIEKAWGIKRFILDMLDLNWLCSPGGYLLIGGGVDGF